MVVCAFCFVGGVGLGEGWGGPLGGGERWGTEASGDLMHMYD